VWRWGGGVREGSTYIRIQPVGPVLTGGFGWTRCEFCDGCMYDLISSSVCARAKALNYSFVATHPAWPSSCRHLLQTLALCFMSCWICSSIHAQRKNAISRLSKLLTSPTSPSNHAVYNSSICGLSVAATVYSSWLATNEEVVVLTGRGAPSCVVMRL
jgi:hypothetical protein